MVTRRAFFGQLAAALLAQKIPVELDPIKLAPVFPSKILNYRHTYGLGFTITREMIEDDTYEKVFNQSIARGLYNQIDNEILRSREVL